jgi:hypothetical protein
MVWNRRICESGNRLRENLLIQYASRKFGTFFSSKAWVGQARRAKLRHTFPL